MGVLSDLVVADVSEAQAVADSVEPAREWEGFTFKGLDHVKLCTLLSLVQTGSPQREFERYLDLIDPVSAPANDGPIVFAVREAEVRQLATIAAMEQDEFQRLARAWAETDELRDWSESEVSDLLRSVADLAESASLQGKCLLLWISL
jgi:hypothetical protein